MQFPYLNPTPQTRVVTDVFRGYDHRLSAADGTFYDTLNLSSRQFPLLSTRLRRGTAAQLTRPGGLIGKDTLCWVADGTLYVNHLATPVTGLTEGEKQLVSMGAYVLIFPDKRYYNTQDPSDYGSMEADLTLSGEIRYSLCDAEGTELGTPQSSAEEPETQTNAALWLDTSGGGRVLRQYSQAQRVWVELESVFTKLSFPSLGRVPALFSRYDGVEISGAARGELNGSKLLYALGGGEQEADYIVVAGLIDAPFTVEGSVRLRRRLPEMDFVCEAQNRLWGCRYGNDGEKNVNEIYASALGDFKNFRQFPGLSTDSWTASVGSDGPWTGAVNYLGRPTFFKENRIHQVAVSSSGAHRLEETICRGVQAGSHKSLQVVGESLYYKSAGQVCVWQGGFPQSVGMALGEIAYDSAAGGSIDGLYYLSMRETESGAWHLFCYDTERGVWYREDALRAQCFAAVRGELYAIDADSGALLALRGTTGEIESSLAWMAETGLLDYQTPERKYVSRYTLTLRVTAGAKISLWLRYDSEGDWEKSGEMELFSSGTAVIPVRPRRCDHLQLRICGEGEVRLCALTRILETGSDM